MKKRNTYYEEIFGRPAMTKRIVLNIFLGLSYYFRVPIEVITRRNMGERYFNLMLTAAIGIALLYVPIMFSSGLFGGVDYDVLFARFSTWYLYTGIYLYASFKRWQEIRRYPSVWDLKRFSLSSGNIHPFFLRLNVREDLKNNRFVSTILEPGVFLIIGILLTILQQPIGIVLMGCAVIYSLGYTASYYLADQYVMDKIDQMICHEDLHDIFVNDIPSQRGFEFSARRPKDKAAREKLYEDYMEAEIVDEDEPQVVK